MRAACALGALALIAGCGSSRGQVNGAAVAPPLLPEAGFVDVPAQPTAATYVARLFYAFQPADSDPAHKPLVVLSNGGPGYSTSAGLLAFGTGRATLDPAAPDAPPAANASRWTAFANLLYVDERLTGFSYARGLTLQPTCTFSEVEDAADFVWVLLDFLDRHPALTGSPVVLGGESYAGTRTDWMLDLLLRYPTESTLGGAGLRERIQRHYDLVFPRLDGGVVDEAIAAEQFGAQVLIQPIVMGSAQYEAQFDVDDPYVTAVTDMSPYDVREPPAWLADQQAAAVAHFGSAADARALLGVGLDSIAEMAPAARASAYHPDAPGSAPPTEAAANQSLDGLLGSLSPPDQYFVEQGSPCSTPWVPSVPSAAIFVANLRHVRTFITHARYDGVVLTAAIPAALQTEGLTVTLDTSPRPGVARPGWFRVALPALEGDTTAPAKTVEVRFPDYDDSGHPVASGQPADLAADVQAFLQSPSN